MSMSGQCLYEDENLENIVTIEDDFTNEDEEDDVDGDAGDEKIKPLWAAIEQTTLADNIDDEVQTIPLAAARFADPALFVIIIGDEKLQITAGGGTASLTVNRGYHGTDPASHTQGDPVRLCYNAANVQVSCRDNEGSDESGMVDYCLDDGLGDPDGDYSAILELGSIAYDEKVALHRRLTVEAETDPISKQDLIHDVEAKLNEYSAS